MNPKTKNKSNAPTTTAQTMAFVAAAWCKEKISATWKRGRPGRAICIGCATAFFLLLPCGCGRSRDSGGVGGDGIGSDWTYNGEAFATVFHGIQEDEGVIYYGGYVDSGILGVSVNHGIEVVQATRDGNLVGRDGDDRMVWVETQKHYEDGESLDGGFYIRRGSFEYEGIGGIQHTVARYVEVTDKEVLEKLQKQVDDEQAAKERAELEAEGEPIEVDAPVKSLFGFSIGATPHSVNKALFENPGEGPGMYSAYNMTGKLATPFRHFDFAELTFDAVPVLGGKHLTEVRLRVWDQPTMETTEEYFEEVKTIVSMLEKKFGIKFEVKERKWRNSLANSSFWCEWKTENRDDLVRQSIAVYFSGTDFGLIFSSDCISAQEQRALKEKQKPAKLSADAGADQL